MEILACTILLIAVAIANAALFGDMAVLTEMMGRKQAMFQLEIDVANTAMKQMDLPHELQSDVRDFLKFTQGTKSEQKDLKEFLAMISPSLVEKVSQLIFSKVIQKNNRFNTVFISKQEQITKTFGIKGFTVDKQELVNMMVNKFKTELREPEFTVIEQYDSTDSMFIIAKGECRVLIVDEKKNQKKLMTLRPGDYFGEIAMIYGCKRTADVISQKYSTLAKLKKTHYKEILFEFPDMAEELKKYIFKYNDRMKRFVMKSIEKVDYFKDVSQDAIHEIMYNMKTEKFHRGQVL